MWARLFANTIVTLCLFTAGVTASANQCLSLFTKSEWDRQLEKAYGSFSENLFNPNLLDYDVNKERAPKRKTIHDGYNNYDYPHSRILRDVFKVKLGRNGKAPTIEQLMDAYTKEIDRLVDSGKVGREDVLLPAFVFKLGKKYIWLQYGDPIPPGAKSSGDVLSEFYFNKMVSEGFFPMGNQFIIQTRIASFEHDMAHLTSFLQFPKYMALVRQTSAKVFKGNIIPREDEGKRIHFLGESLSLINEASKTEMFSSFLFPQGKSIYDFTHAEVTAHLKTLPKEDVMNMLLNLTENYQRYFDHIGGSTRDYVNGANDPLYTPYRVMISDAIAAIKYEERFEQAASIQIILIRLSQTKLEDWFKAIEKVDLDPNSSIGKLFKDDAVWNIESGEMRSSFTGR